MTAGLRAPATVRCPGAVVRIGPASAVLRWRAVLVLAAGAVLLLLASTLSLGRGDFPIGVADVLRSLRPEARRRVVHRDSGPERLRQVHAPARPGPAPAPLRRPGPPRRSGDRRTPTRDVAKVLGLLPQTPVAPEGITVADLVARGRHPHQSWLRQ